MVNLYEERFAVTPCEYFLLSCVSFEKNRWLTTQHFDKYVLIIFRRKGEPYQ